MKYLNHSPAPPFLRTMVLCPTQTHHVSFLKPKTVAQRCCFFKLWEGIPFTSTFYKSLPTEFTLWPTITILYQACHLNHFCFCNWHIRKTSHTINPFSICNCYYWGSLPTWYTTVLKFMPSFLIIVTIRDCKWQFWFLTFPLLIFGPTLNPNKRYELLRTFSLLATSSTAYKSHFRQKKE